MLMKSVDNGGRKRELRTQGKVSAQDEPYWISLEALLLSYTSAGFEPDLLLSD